MPDFPLAVETSEAPAAADARGAMPAPGPPAASATQRSAALVVAAALLLLFALAWPQARSALPPLRAMVAPYQAILALVALLTASLLLAQARSTGSQPLLLLGCSYWFSAWMTVAHAVGLPGGGSTAAAAWLQWLWHGGFALGVAGYAAWPARQARSVRLLPALAASSALVALALLLAGAAAPSLAVGAAPRAALTLAASAIGVLALALQWRRGLRSLHDLWLRVVLLAWLLALLLGGSLHGSRFDLGWYAGQLCTLVADATLLVALLLESSRLQGHLAAAGLREQRLQAELLRTSQARFETTFAHAAVGMALLTPQLTWLRANPKLCELLGCAEDELVDRDALQWLHAQDRESARQTIQRMLDGGLPGSISQRRLLRRDGSSLWVQTTLALVRGQAGAPEHFIGVIEDIQSRKDAQEALRDAEQRFRTVFDHAPVSISIHHAHTGELLQANTRALAQCGGAAQPATPAKATAGAGFACAGAAREIRSAASAERLLEWRSLDAQGQPRWEEVQLSPVQLDGQSRVLAIATDITARKELQRRILEVTTAEQERIGREIHDGIGQQLTALTLLSSGLQRRLRGAGQVVEADALQQLQQHLESALAQARALARGLAAVDIDRRGLPQALRTLVADVESATGTACLYRGLDNLDLGDASRGMHLLRIAQEAMNNALRHAHATSIELRLKRLRGELVLQVLDDGMGIDAATARKGNLGLHTMAYRAGALGGRLAVRRRRPKGTEVRCTVPLPEKADAQRAGAQHE